VELTIGDSPPRKTFPLGSRQSGFSLRPENFFSTPDGLASSPGSFFFKPPGAPTVEIPAAGGSIYFDQRWGLAAKREKFGADIGQ
jgi:hypothetical protein